MFVNGGGEICGNVEKNINKFVPFFNIKIESFFFLNQKKKSLLEFELWDRLGQQLLLVKMEDWLLAA